VSYVDATPSAAAASARRVLSQGWFEGEGVDGDRRPSPYFCGAAARSTLHLPC
jgi:hypothetical protein